MHFNLANLHYNHIIGATMMKGATHNKVGPLTKEYSIDVAFMYWFIKYQIIF
jgi:hypothetical protein